MLKRVSAIALTVAMLLSMVCTFSFASAAEPMSLSVVADKDVAERGDVVTVTINVENYVPCAALGVLGAFDPEVFEPLTADDIVVEDVFSYGAVNPNFGGTGKFYINKASVENEDMPASFKLATVALKLKTNKVFDASDISVAFYGNDMTKIDNNVAVEMVADTDYSAAAVVETVALKPIAAADKMEIILKDAPATVVRGEVFEVLVAVKNYKSLASYSFDLNYDNTVLDLVSADALLGGDATIDLIWKDASSVRVMEISSNATNLGADAAEATLAKVTFAVRKDAPLNKAAGLTAKFVESDGVEDTAMGYQLANGEYAEMVPGYEFVSATATADTTVVENTDLMVLNVTASPLKADRGELIALGLSLDKAIPFAGMTVDIPVDADVFEVENIATVTGAYIDADVVTIANKKVIRVILANGANMADVTDLATITLKVKDDAAFGKVQLKDAYIKQAAATNGTTVALVEGADYKNVSNLIELEIACDHIPENYVVTSNENGTHDVNCDVNGCDYRLDDVACSDADPIEHNPTCTEAGYFENVCECGYTWNVDSNKPALDHDLKYVHVDGTVATASKHVVACSRGDYSEEFACTFTEVSTTPSCQKNVMVTATCTGCGYSYQYEKLNTKTEHGKDKIRYYAPTATVAGKWAYYCNSCKAWATEVAIAAGHPFPDVKKPTSWFYDGVMYAKVIGVVSGDDKGNFNPNNNINRAEVATILVRYLGYEAEYKDMTAVEFETYLNALYVKTGVAKKNLSDLKADKWFYRATSVACALGIFQGDNNNKFNPNNNISRQEFCLVLYRLYKDAGLKIDTAKTYADIAKVPSWSKEAVQWAGSVGLFNGDEKGNFNATQNATRAQIAALMMRIDVCIRNVEVM